MQECGIISLKGNFGQTGFGFSCLQQASKLKITGYFKYISSENVQIYIEGSKLALQSFHRWCMEQNNTDSGVLNVIPGSTKHREFNIINHL